MHRWHRAVNDGDADAARAVAADDVDVGGPRGTATGVDAFTDWVRRSGAHLEPVSWHPVDATTVVVEQDATWPGRADAGAGRAPVRVATLFRVDGQRVARAVRFDDLHAALIAAGGR